MAVVLVPTFVGLVIGLVVALAPGSQYAAAAWVDAGPGTTSADAASVPPDMQERFVQSELARIDSEDAAFAQAIREGAGIEDPPPVDGRQVAGTNIISLSVTYPNPAKAAEIANIAADTYIAEWRERTAAEADAQVAALDDALQSTATQLTALPESGGTPEQATTRSVLTEQFDQLTSERALAYGQAASARKAERLVSSATEGAATLVTSPLRGAALGALLGLVVGVAVLLFVRQRDGIPNAAGAP